MKEYRLKSKRGAVRWGEAYPVGNGHLGAMIYGSTPVNRIDLSQNTFYSGAKEEYCQEGAAAAFQKMRVEAERGNYREVHETAEGFIGKRGNYGTNLPVGSLYIAYGTETQHVRLKERSLSILDGIAKRNINIEETDTYIEEKIFASNKDHVLAFQTDGTNYFDIQFQLQLAAEGIVYYQGYDTHTQILFECHAHELLHCERKTGVTLNGQCILVSDGIVETDRQKISIRKCKWVHVFVNMQTDFLKLMGWEDRFEQIPLFTQAVENVIETVSNTRKGAFLKNYCDRCMGDLYERHTQDVRSFMERSTLIISDTDRSIGDEISFLYQYGRYLLLSSSREDSILPAHLQGIWNDNVACRIGWSCDMHLDINTQMNYWPAEVTNLSETTKPLFHWIEHALYPTGKVTAKKCYGLKGWVGEIVSNAWGYAMPYWASPIAPCPTGGVWILTHMWEHYLYTEDKLFLEQQAYPLIESAVLFFKDYVFETEKGISCGPSISPENSFREDDRLYQISNGCTYELTMLRELFHIYLMAVKELKKEESDMIFAIEDKWKRLLPYRITKEGTIAEYHHDLEIPDKQHRHTSHLLGLFPFSQITPEKSPKLCKAVEKTILQKVTPIENWEDTGWASSMLMLYEARLGHGNQAYGHMRRVIEKLLEPNAMVYHPPTRGTDAFDHVYELDGNTGFVTCIAEMLLQSHDEIIRILPALPDAWESGEVNGLRARGNIVVNLQWKNHRLQRLQCESPIDRKCTFLIDGEIRKIKLQGGVAFITYRI